MLSNNHVKKFVASSESARSSTTVTELPQEMRNKSQLKKPSSLLDHINFEQKRRNLNSQRISRDEMHKLQPVKLVQTKFVSSSNENFQSSSVPHLVKNSSTHNNRMYFEYKKNIGSYSDSKTTTKSDKQHQQQFMSKSLYSCK